MIIYKTGDITQVKEGIIMHGCNAQGVMGSGVALAIKNKFPMAYENYKLYASSHSIDLGDIVWAEITANKLWIANAISQRNYGRSNIRYVNYSAIVKCFDACIDNALIVGCGINFPKIGAGLGGGDWNIIEQLINDCDPNDEVEKVCWELP
mgnify:CR=1 FL=1